MACVSFSTLCNPLSFHPSLYSKTSPFNQYISLKPTASNSRTLIVATTLANAEPVVDERPKFRWVDIRPNSEQLSEDQKFSISKLPKNMTKRCKAFMRQIICYSPEKGTLWDLVASWVRLMKPVRVDWLAVLKELSDLDHPLFPQVFECALSEDSFEPNVRDYTKMIHFYAKKNNLQDAENTIFAMTQKGMGCDQVTLTTIIHMYSKAGNFIKAEEIFDEMQLLGHPLDKRSYGSMIMAYIRAGMLEKGEALVLKMEADEIYAGKEVYKALLRAYSMNGDYEGSQRVFNAIQLSGGDPTGTGKGGTSIWGKKFTDEIRESLKHNARGTLSMANSGPNTNGSQFFLTYAKQPHLNGLCRVFGKVIHGFEVLDLMEKTQVGAGDRPLAEIRLNRVTLHANPLAA